MKRVFYHCSSSPFVDLLASWRWVGQNLQTYSLLPKSTDQVGSANINDRSLLGNRDAELGVVTWAGQFPKTLRETLLRCLVDIWGWRCRWRMMAPSLDEPNKIPNCQIPAGFPAVSITEFWPNACLQLQTPRTPFGPFWISKAQHFQVASIQTL